MPDSVYERLDPRRCCASAAVLAWSGDGDRQVPSELTRKPGTNTVMTSALAIRSSRTVPKFIQAPAVALAVTT